MISSSQIWIGSFPEAYEDDIRIWTSERSSGGGELHIIDCANVNFRRIKDSEVEFDPDLLLNVFSTNSIFFDSSKTILLKNAQLWDVVEEWSSGRGSKKIETSVWQLIDALNLIEELDEDVNIGIAFHTGADPSEDVMKFMINGQDDVNDYSLFYSDPNEVAKWIAMWLSVRGYTIKNADALKVAEHLGEEISMVPALVGVLRSYIEVNDPDSPVTYNKLSPNLGKLGFTKIYEIQNSIEKGNQAAVYEDCLRIYESGMGAMMGSLKMIMSRLSNYGKVLDDSEYIPPRMTSGSTYYLRNAAKRLGKRRLLACYEMGVLTDAAFKGYGEGMITTKNSAAGAESAEFVNLHLFYSFIAGQFAATSKTKGAR